MFPIQRYLDNKFIKIYFFMLFAACFADNAWATYSVAVVGNNYVVIGADSRQTDPQGGSDDNVCKIIKVDDHLVFTLVGFALVKSGKNGEVFDIASELHKYSRVGSLPDWTLSFSNMVVRRINEGGDTRLGRVPYFSRFVFAGIEDGKPMLSIAEIKVDRNTNKLIPIDNVIVLSEPYVYPFALPMKTTQEIIRDKDFVTKTHDELLTESHRAASAVIYLIDKIINAGYKGIGGIPTVIIIEPNKPMMWYSHASKCDDLN